METNFPIKSLIVNSSEYEIKACYDDAFKEGVWNMCISSIIGSELKMGYSTAKHMAVTCNFVTGVRPLYQGSGPHDYNQPLAMFMVESNQKNIHQSFEKTWFRVNKPSDCLRLNLIDAQTDLMRNGSTCPHGFYSFHVLFQRVK